MSARPNSGEREFTGKHMLMLMIGMFGTIIAVNGVMAWLALGSWTGLVVPNSYVASQHFNETLQQARAQDRLGWSSRFDHRDGSLRFVVKTAGDRFVQDLQVTARLSIPAHEDRDHDVVLNWQPDGSYAAADTLEPGLWQADVTATGADGTLYRQIFRFLIKQGP